MRASIRTPTRAVAYRRVKLIPNRSAARATIATRYGQSACRLWTTELSIVRWIRIGIVSDTPE